MSSYTPQTDLPLERSRLIGMILGGVSYGVYLLLTVQAVTALMQRPRRGQKIADHRRILLCYVLLTPSRCIGGPVALIENVMHYRINFVAILWQAPLPIHLHTTLTVLSSGYITEWFMQALLVYRCFLIWDCARHVLIPMFVVYVGMIVAIVVLVQAGTGALFYNINTTLAYLVFLVANTVLYTILVVTRLLSMRSRMKTALASNYGPSTYDPSIYDHIIRMVVESAMAYSVFVVIYIVAFSVHSDTVSTLCFLSINQVQGIAQLFIIIRVARGRATTRDWSTRNASVAPTALAFAGTVSIPEGANVTRAARPEQVIVSESCFTSAKSAEAIV
ncbi:hypothetical protein EV424DRAFT_1537221 [Suillus variegatus]|nr:hypothetical protein EV424DRAFT_1537221 [Suillus variegatus]